MEFITPPPDPPEQVARNAERANRVPHPQQVDPRLATGDPAHIERILPPVRRPGPVMVPDLLHPVEIALVQQPDQIDEPGQAAHREGAARKPEHRDPVPRLEVQREESVRLLHVAPQPDAQRTADEAVEPIAGADALVVIDQLRGAVPRAGQDGARHLGDVGRAAGLIGGVPGAVAADDQQLRHRHPSQATTV